MSLDPAPALTAPTPTAAVHLPSTWWRVDDHRYDLTTRALVVGVVTTDRDAGRARHEAERLTLEGADLLSLLGADLDGDLIEEIVATCGVPVLLEHPGGAVLGDLDATAGPGHLLGAAERGSSVLLGGGGSVEQVVERLPGRLLAARAAGIVDERIALDVSSAPAALDLALSLGRPVAVAASRRSSPPGTSEPTDAASAVGFATVTIRRGARIVQTRHVAAVRRTVDVLAAVLEVP